MDYWQPAPAPRKQLVLFTTTLESRIPEDHPVRLLDEILARCDWSSWEAHYDGRRGQPPMHPRVLASVILYGMTRQLRSSRQLEYAIHHNIDFIWLAEGRSIDHSTLCKFRTTHKDALKELYRNILKTAAAMGLIRLAEVAIDGSRILANSSRHATLTVEKAEKLLKELEQQLEQALKQTELADAVDQLLGDDESHDVLPPEVANLKERQAKLEEILEQLQESEKARRRAGVNGDKNPAQIPTTDPSSRILPNKEGGFAANYTPMAAVDCHGGFIISADVLASTAEQTLLTPMLEDILETFGELPEAALADGVYPTGDNLEKLDAMGVELYSPLPGQSVEADNPAIREDPSQPVASEDIERLPINAQSKRLDKSAFIYNEEEDTYYCPDGRRLEYEETKGETRRGQRVVRRVYRSKDCAGCPLHEICMKDETTKRRSIHRDIHEKRRQQHAAKMASEEAKARYAKRFHFAEVPFAILKHVFGLRRFLLRGLEKVKTEWLWACTAFNVTKLMRAVAKLRAEVAQTG